MPVGRPIARGGRGWIIGTDTGAVYRGHSSRLHIGVVFKAHQSEAKQFIPSSRRTVHSLPICASIHRALLGWAESADRPCRAESALMSRLSTTAPSFFLHPGLLKHVIDQCRPSSGRTGHSLPICASIHRALLGWAESADRPCRAESALMSRLSKTAPSFFCTQGCSSMSSTIAAHRAGAQGTVCPFAPRSTARC